ncbi:pollen-specific leucine-rich repeat extensin-like protein 3 [Iris pallida]|uniref:Pollen-specific leucine-rich repeat extensin-like protein 3 n=1 Tax=Iris pallida TaxID=29817 RepID=A0AAX6FYF1_IRIPA|nr:pollen-specific leucine-rich repeat extensin-like protein 3 [Iris pallida]
MRRSLDQPLAAEGEPGTVPAKAVGRGDRQVREEGFLVIVVGGVDVFGGWIRNWCNKLDEGIDDTDTRVRVRTR